MDSIYKGQPINPINKLQNSIIVLIFNIPFVGDLILNTSCDFHYDDVTMMSVINSTLPLKALHNYYSLSWACYRHMC